MSDLSMKEISMIEPIQQNQLHKSNQTLDKHSDFKVKWKFQRRTTSEVDQTTIALEHETDKAKTKTHQNQSKKKPRKVSEDRLSQSRASNYFINLLQGMDRIEAFAENRAFILGQKNQSSYLLAVFVF
ncbi:hypothetical protein ACLOJK_022027 [Asimina triloba]